MMLTFTLFAHVIVSKVVDMTGAGDVTGASTPVAASARAGATSRSTGDGPAPAPAAAPFGGMSKRVRTRMKEAMKKSSPPTKEAFKVIRNHIAAPDHNATKDIIQDGEDDGDDSQDVLSLLIENTKN